MWKIQVGIIDSVSRMIMDICYSGLVGDDIHVGQHQEFCQDEGSPVPRLQPTPRR